MARRSNSLTKFLQDLVDNSKDLVDDLIERGSDLESDIRSAATRVVSNDDGHDDEDLDKLQVSLAELSAKVDQLAKSQRQVKTG